MRHHPISPVTEPMQYRAIGVVRGQYVPTDAEQPTRGLIHTADGTAIEAVVLGRVLSLVRRHLDMASPHLWVVYPRIREPGSLHLQMVGVWEPSTLDAVESPPADDQPPEDSLPEGDDYFSVRGELIFTRPESGDLVIKVRQKPRADGTRVQPFKLQLRGQIPLEHLRHFVSLDLRRQASQLEVERFEVIGPVAQRGNRGGKDRSGSGRSSADRSERKPPRNPISRGEALPPGGRRTAIIRPGS
ncbi:MULTISPECIES: hypothetical protein [unclassified Synechococcus]|uniref:hypothetical protein n=1 Tax=unclassified Synechococcus TaxID=2626047 RepID=UPI0021A42A36|nr:MULTISPECIES: hypothetical protein [unclassified Synechococcus]